ncbi:MAG: hypothetical protein R3C30_08085 [Hyphomonadaceae bacterium]
MPIVESFLDKGYAVIPDALSPDACDALVARFRRFERDNAEKLKPFIGADGHHYPQLVNIHLAMTELFDTFAHNPKALAVQDFLFDAETCLYTSLFYERGSANRCALITPFFCTRRISAISACGSRLRMNEDNGPLMALGGHLLSEMDRNAIARNVLGAGAPMPTNSPELERLPNSGDT